MGERFLTYCDDVWSQWLAGELDFGSFACVPFETGVAPEPYVRYRAGDDPLVVLLTNPGGPMKIQERGFIKSDLAQPVNSKMSWAEASVAFGKHYRDKLPGTAGNRIGGMIEIANGLGREGVLQVDACPVHSSRLPMKRKGDVVRAFGTDCLVGRHAQLVQEYLRPYPVVALTAAPTRAGLTAKDQLSEWAAWVAGIAGVDIEHAEFVELVKKDSGKITAAALVSGVNGVPKALVRMMGGNHLPATEGLHKLVEAMGAKV